MKRDYMELPETVERAIVDARAMVRLGFPWWLRPFVASDVVAITLGRRIYLSARAAKRSASGLERLMLHELAHVAQVNRLGLFVFLWRYVAEFFRHYWKVRSVAAAYRLISFEIEANAAEEPYNRASG